MDTTVSNNCCIQYNNWYLLFCLDDSLLSRRTSDSHLKRIISTNCYIHTVVPPDDGL